jgi:four helix bundle protein
MRMHALRDRTKQFALRIVRMVSELPRSMTAQVLGRQVLRSGTSVAANLREATRARSDAEFTAKPGIVEQELDETLLWLELLSEGGIIRAERLAPLHEETEELLKIVVTSIKTARKRAASQR